MFGESTTTLILYLAPVTAAQLAAYGFTTGVLEDLLEEKASIVFSYLPIRYRRLYSARVLRMLVVPAAYAGQTSVAAPFSLMSNLVGFVNPSGEVNEFYVNNTPVIVSTSSPSLTLTFDALSVGDKLYVDFDNNLTGYAVPGLAWATKVIAAIDLLSTISGDLESGELIPRIKADGDRVFAWLEGLNANAPNDRIIIKELEFQFYDGSQSLMAFSDLLIKNLMGGQDFVVD